MRIRLRSKYTDDELAKIYRKPHNSSAFGIDHQYRIAMSIAMIQVLMEAKPIRSVADLSAGDGSIIDALEAPTKYIGDFAPRYAITGPIEQTINEIPEVDLFICSETLEHLDDPDSIMRMIGRKAKYVFVSTPDDEVQYDNPEHYWRWDREEINKMLWQAGYAPIAYGEARVPYLFDYGFQLHIGERQ